MVQDQGIDVYLAPHSDTTKRYPEHAVPSTSPVFSSNANEVYIEAVDGERFVIVVDLLKDFDAKGSKNLKIDYGIDGGGTMGQSSYPQPAKCVRKHARLRGRDIAETEVRKIDGRWVRCGYTFAQLNMDEDMDMDADQVASRVNTHGKIVVLINRGKYIPTNTKHTGLWNLYEPPDTRISSKAVVKENHVSHAIRHIVLEDAAQPTYGLPVSAEWKDLADEGGKTISFTIRYRSRDALQKLKIIPKDMMSIDLTNSPPPSPKVKVELGARSIKRETTVDGHQKGNIKLEATDADSSGSAGTRPSDGAVNTPLTPTEQHDKKRKALQDELREVELEQKRLRLEKQLAEMEEDGK